MSYDYLDIAATTTVKAAQQANGSLEAWNKAGGQRQSKRFTQAEAAFIAERDSFYMATVSESGWPYLQHRGGPAGFLRVLNDTTLGFADFRGNRQYISLGNLMASDRAALFLMDYRQRQRLKIFAHVEIKKTADDPALAARLIVPGYKAQTERLMLLHLEAFDWNCPQHITPRFTETDIEEAFASQRQS